MACSHTDRGEYQFVSWLDCNALKEDSSIMALDTIIQIYASELNCAHNLLQHAKKPEETPGILHPHPESER